MHVISWTHMAQTVVCAGLSFYQAFHLENFGDILLLCALAYATLCCLQLAFSKEAYEASQAKAAQEKRVYCNLYGRFALLGPYLPLLPLPLSWALALLLPWELRVWPCLLGLAATAAAMLWLTGLVEKHRVLEETMEQQDRPTADE